MKRTLSVLSAAFFAAALAMPAFAQDAAACSSGRNGRDGGDWRNGSHRGDRRDRSHWSTWRGSIAGSDEA